MNSKNEFNKPLKGVRAEPKTSRRKPMLVAAGILAIAALPVFQFYGGVSLFMPEKQDQVVASAPVQQLQPEVAVSQEVTATIPSRNHELDPDGGDFQEVVPQGEIAPILPKPKPVQQQRSQPVKRQELALAHLPDPGLIERGASGVIPKVSSNGLKALDVYSRAPDTEGNFGVARIVLVIGGLGISQTSTKDAIEQLPPNVTLAFAPYGNSLSRWMQRARKSGHELLLQVPMEPIDYPKNNPGPHTLRTDAALQENLANLHWTMSRLTNYVGVTNYLGNKILQEPAGLSPIFAEISKRGLMFFEDGSVKNTMGPGVAVKELVPYAKADVLIDNVRSRAAIGEKLQQLVVQAKRTGLAIGMGNAFPDTIDMVSQFAKQARQNGIEITPVSAVVRPTKK